MNLDLAKQGLGVGTPSEPSVAAAGDVIFYTQNFTAGYSTDGGITWRSLNPYSDVPSIFGGFCCDQVVIYVPQVRKFVWLLQYWHRNRNIGSTSPPPGDQESAIRMVVASPQQVAAGNPSTWRRYDFDSTVLNNRGLGFDQPDLAVGARMLYMTVDQANLTTGKVFKSYVVRIGVNQLGRATMGVQWALVDQNYLHPVQHVRHRAYFAQHVSTSELRTFYWDENVNARLHQKVPNIKISTIPDQNWTSNTQGGADWLSRTATSGGQRIRGATLAGNRIWLAWSAARDTTVDGRTKQLFKQPHIEIAKLDPGTLELKDQDYIFNDDYAFARPALDTNFRGEVGMSFGWGGSKSYANQGVAFLTGKREFWSSWQNDADPPGGGANNPHGDYATIRAGWPHSGCFLTVAVGYRGGAGIGRIVTFDRQGDLQQCTPRPRFLDRSSIRLACPSGILTANDPVSVQGTIEPTRPAVPVTISWRAPNGSVITHTVSTNAGSAFADSGPTGQAGTWRVTASWRGDSEHLSATATCSFFKSNPPSPGKSASAVTIQCPAATAIQYSTLSVSGRIEPTHANTPMTVTYTRFANGQSYPTVHNLSTDGAGNFGDSFGFDIDGNWEIQAAWAGDADHDGSASAACPLEVFQRPR